MRSLYFFLLSLMASLVLFMIFSFFYGRRPPKALNLDSPIQIVLKSRKGRAMNFWEIVYQGIDEASMEFGVQVEITGPGYEKQINQQITILNRVIEKNPPLIILASTDYKRLSKPVKRAHDRNIPILLIDSGVDSNIPLSFIGTNNIDAGKKAGREMKRLITLSNRKDIAIVSHIKETTSAIDREVGARYSLKDESIIGTWYCDVEEDKAYRIVLGLLKNKDLGGIVALNEVVALGVARAISEQHAQDRVAFVAFDNAIPELTYLEEGIIKATVVQRPYNMGYLAVKTAVEYLRGEKIVSNIDTGSVLITKENMFKREFQEMLFPFSYQMP